MNAAHQKERRLKGKTGTFGQVDWERAYRERLAAHPQRAAQAEMRRRRVKPAVA